MKNLWQDIRIGIRSLGRNRMVTIIAIAALALGIGANTAIFSVVNTVLLRPLPYPQPDRLVWFWESQPDLEQAPFSAADSLDYQAQNQSFAEMAVTRQMSFTMTGNGQAERIPGIISSTNVFSLLGVHPMLGREFLPTEGVAGTRRTQEPDGRDPENRERPARHLGDAGQPARPRGRIGGHPLAV